MQPWRCPMCASLNPPGNFQPQEEQFTSSGSMWWRNLGQLHNQLLWNNCTKPISLASIGILLAYKPQLELHCNCTVTWMLNCVLQVEEQHKTTRQSPAEHDDPLTTTGLRYGCWDSWVASLSVWSSWLLTKDKTLHQYQTRFHENITTVNQLWLHSLQPTEKLVYTTVCDANVWVF